MNLVGFGLRKWWIWNNVLKVCLSLEYNLYFIGSGANYVLFRCFYSFFGIKYDVYVVVM